jgi:hypothetical protein
LVLLVLERRDFAAIHHRDGGGVRRRRRRRRRRRMRRRRRRCWRLQLSSSVRAYLCMRQPLILKPFSVQ